MKTIKIKNLKSGNSINHPEHGFLQFHGLVTTHPFTKVPKVPHRYIFWQPVNEDGVSPPDIILTDGNLIVELEDDNEC